MPKSFRYLSTIALAAQTRVATWESHANGGLQIKDKGRELSEALSGTDYIVRKIRWDSLFSASHISVLAASVSVSRQCGANPSAVIADLAKNSPRPWTRATALAVRKRFQGEVYRKLHARSTFDPEARIRHKIARFDFSDRSRTQAYRGLIAFDKLRVLVPPRVVAAVFSTIWNRWMTAR